MHQAEQMNIDYFDELEIELLTLFAKAARKHGFFEARTLPFMYTKLQKGCESSES